MTKVTIKSVILPTDVVRSLLDGSSQEFTVKRRGLRGFAPGDILWVKETYDEVHPVAVQPGRFTRTGRAGIPAYRAGGGGPFRVIYKTDGDSLPHWPCSEFPFRSLEPQSAIARNLNPSGKSGWYPSMMMPVWASRLTLFVRSVSGPGTTRRSGSPFIERTLTTSWIVRAPTAG